LVTRYCPLSEPIERIGNAVSDAIPPASRVCPRCRRADLGMADSHVTLPNLGVFAANPSGTTASTSWTLRCLARSFFANGVTSSMAAWQRARAKPPPRSRLQRCTTGHYHSFASYLDPYQTAPFPGLDAARQPTTIGRSIPLNRTCLGLPPVVHVPLLLETALCANPVRPSRSPAQRNQYMPRRWNQIAASRRVNAIRKRGAAFR